MLVAVAEPAFAQYVGLIGASGGALGLAAAANEYVNDRSAARLKPFYFMWLLERETHRHDSALLVGAREPSASPAPRGTQPSLHCHAASDPRALRALRFGSTCQPK
jgi:hypothetical protein